MDPKKMVTRKHYILQRLPSKLAKNVIGIILSASFIGACSQVPKSVNPVEWFTETVEFFSDQDTKTYKNINKNKLAGLPADQEKPPIGSDESFPNLASVDKQVRARDVTAHGLPADTERPKYAPSIKRQGLASLNINEQPQPVNKAISLPRPMPVLPSVGSTQLATTAIPKPFMAQKSIPKKINIGKYSVSQKISSPKIIEGQGENQKRLTSQLAEIRSRSANRGTGPIMIRDIARRRGEFSTIVISSQGVSFSEVGTKVSQLPILAEPSVSLNSTSQLNKSASKSPGNEVKVATIFYDNGSYKLKALDKKILNAVASLQNKDGGWVRIVGHASSRTRNLSPIKHKMVNLKISIDRADEIANTLVQLGVKNKNIQIAAVSDAQPAYYEFMMSGEAGNRRTDIYLTR